MVEVLGFEVCTSGLRVHGPRFIVLGSWMRAQGSGMGG